LLQTRGNIKNLIILNHFHTHTKYIIRELKPDTLLWVNGSCSKAVHLNEEYWEAVNNDTKIKLISPFSSEKTAHAREKKLSDVGFAKIKNSLKNLMNKKRKEPIDFMKFCLDVGTTSWDWTGTMGAVIVRSRDKKILTYSHNVVLPYETAMLHEGCSREKVKSARGEDQDLTETNHAETMCITKIASTPSVSLKGTELYTKAFPCPTCARVIASSPIEKIYYNLDYANEIGYRILKRSGKKIERVLV